MGGAFVREPLQVESCLCGGGGKNRGLLGRSASSGCTDSGSGCCWCSATGAGGRDGTSHTSGPLVAHRCGRLGGGARALAQAASQVCCGAGDTFSGSATGGAPCGGDRRCAEILAGEHPGGRAGGAGFGRQELAIEGQRAGALGFVGAPPLRGRRCPGQGFGRGAHPGARKRLRPRGFSPAPAGGSLHGGRAASGSQSPLPPCE
mmetsp:Transcript_46263/g.98879  ORF Transcript_46263/g.98879 Transcript_46263/m.98879 type:complete len:204 (-) Transcript_46263:1464-2075(-)